MTDKTELNRLIVLASSDGKARAELAGCVDRPHQVQAARAALARLDAPSVHAPLKATGLALGQGSAK